MQVTEGDGAVYAMTLNIPLSPDHREHEVLLEELQPGARVCARGHLHTEQSFGRHFATEDDPDGRSSRQDVVDDITRATDDYMDGT